MKIVYVLVAVSLAPSAGYTKSVAVFKAPSDCYTRLKKVELEYPYTQLLCTSAEVTDKKWTDELKFNTMTTSVELK
ncbi:MAG: hypothetical protein HY052_01360 [Proteobacteria bacterium]|nr:hypothetical protein [Pseudomonadota bacterium]